GMETFEETPVGGKVPFPAPLAWNTPNAAFPNGISEQNLLIQDNIPPTPFPANVNPSGHPQALYLAGPGFINANSHKIGEDLFNFTQQIASLDLIFTPAEHTAVGFELSRFQGFGMGGWLIGVYDVNNIQIGAFPVPSPGVFEPSKTFFGVWSPVPIGRINVFDNAQNQAGQVIPAADAIDNIEMYVPAPGTALIVAAFPLLARRRRA